MNITVNLNKDFEREFNLLKEEYGDDFAELNGLSDDKLSYNDFLDGFVSKKTVADSSVDGSSNVHNKDIVTLRSEMSKPHEKLMAYSKIFKEMKDQYGLRTAKKWMNLEWNKALYLHDANSSTFVPYSYKGTELVTVLYKDNLFLCSFSDLYDIVDEPEELLSEKDGAYCKYAQNLFVMDSVDNKQVWTKVLRVIRKPRTNDFMLIKTANGFSQIVTDNHPLITQRGDVLAKDISASDKLFTLSNQTWSGNVETLYVLDEIAKSLEDGDNVYFRGELVDDSTDKHADGFVQVDKVSGSKHIQYWHTYPFKNVVHLTENLGYIIGLAITDGTYFNRDSVKQGKKRKSGRILITQNKGPVLDKLIMCLEAERLPYNTRVVGKRTSITIESEVFALFCKSAIITCSKGKEKSFVPNIINYNINFIRGVIAGCIDGDGTVLNDKFEFFSASRTLFNQVSHILRCFGYSPKARCTKEDTWWRLSVKVLIDKEYINIPSVKIREKLKPVISQSECEKYSNKRYSYNDDEAYVIDWYVINTSDKYVYDITTETGHFISNDIISHNCFAYDLTKVATDGLFYLDDHNKPEPAKHLETFVDFVKEFINFTSNRTSGACGLPNLIPYMYYFWYQDVKSNHFPRCQNEETFAKSEIQRIIYGMNQPYTRDGIQSAFVNTSIFDSEYFDALFGGSEFPNGELMIDHKEGIMKFQKWFLEEMSAIKDRGRMFTFPVNSISLLRQNGKFIDEDFAKWASNHNRKWNDSNIFADKDVTSLSNCCRLKSSLKDIGYFNSIGGSGLRVGSVKVSTINLARIAYESNKNERKYLEILKDRLIIDMKLLHVIRKIIERNVEKNLLPNFQDGIMDFEHLYNTIGINGVYETMKYFGYTEVDEFNNTLYKDEAMNFGKKIFDLIHESIKEFTVDKNYTVNCEQIPGETAAAKFIQADKLLHDTEVVTDLPIYGNQWIPLGIKTTLKERIRICSAFDGYCNGGSIMHVNVDAPIENEQTAWELLEYLTDQGVTYFAFNGKLSTDDNQHLFYGDICPECGNKKTAEYTRTVGFYTKIASWSKERKEEYKLREWQPLNDKGIDA